MNPESPAKTYLHALLPDPAGGSDGPAYPRGLVGAKGSGLRDLLAAGLPVPPGFTVSTEAGAYFHLHGGRWPAGLETELREHLAQVERATGRRLGDPRQPLLLAVRRGNSPGALLNVGLNDKTVLGLARLTGREAAAWHCYRRFLELFGPEVLGLDPEWFDTERERILRKYKARQVEDLRPDQVQEVVEAYQKAVLPKARVPMAFDAADQLALALAAAARVRGDAPSGSLARGAAVHVQAMVLTNLGPDSGLGAAFSRDPVTGEARPSGQYTTQTQGGDPAAARPARRLEDMAGDADPAWKTVHTALLAGLATLEETLRHPQEVEFAVEKGRLWYLQTRPARRGAVAGMRWAVELATGRDLQSGRPGVRRWTPREALGSLAPDDVRQAALALAAAQPAGRGRRRGSAALAADPLQKMIRQVSSWSDELRELQVFASLAAGEEAVPAAESGADGADANTLAALTQGDRLWTLRESLFSSPGPAREKKLARLVAPLRKEFEAHFEAFLARPVHLRLPELGPEHLLPQSDKEWRELARRTDTPLARLQAAAQPWQHLRGARALLALPELVSAVVRAGVEAAGALESRKAVRPQPGWWLPAVTGHADTGQLATLIRTATAEASRTVKTRVEWSLGLLVQTPRAALIADQLADTARWFCFDLRELTRGLLGLDRAETPPGDGLRNLLDSGRSFDMAGLGALLRNSIGQTRLARPDARFGATGLDATDPALFRHLTRIGIEFACADAAWTSVARLTAAQASGK